MASVYAEVAVLRGLRLGRTGSCQHGVAHYTGERDAGAFDVWGHAAASAVRRPVRPARWTDRPPSLLNSRGALASWDRGERLSRPDPPRSR